MELEELKNAWQNTEMPKRDITDIRAMLSENNHPVLKGIRKQGIIEVVAWSTFLLCYYSMFDGERKPAWVNLVLVMSVLFPLVHNLTGYSFARYLINGPTLKESLTAYLAKIKSYALVSIASRLLFAVGFIFFFVYGVSFNNVHWYLFGILGVIFGLQLWFLFRIWQKRLNSIKAAVKAFE
jgi:hypothetical protein